MLHCPATPGGSFSGGDAGDKSLPGFGDRALSQKLGPLLGLASTQGTGREEPTLALRFHFREVTERNPNEQKPTKVFESPVTQNHQDRAQLHQQLPGAAQGRARCRDGCPGCRHCLWIGALPHPTSFPDRAGSARGSERRAGIPSGISQKPRCLWARALLCGISAFTLTSVLEHQPQRLPHDGLQDGESQLRPKPHPNPGIKPKPSNSASPT